MVGVEIRTCLGEYVYSFDTVKQLHIKIVHCSTCCYTICQHLHLATTDTRRDIGHAVVIPNMGVLIMWGIITCLCGQENSLIFIFLGMAHDGSATRCGDNFISIKAQDSKTSKSSTSFTFIG